MADFNDVNGALSVIFTLMPQLAPLKYEPVRKVIHALVPLLMGSADPVIVALGAALESGTKIIDRKYEKRRKK